MQSVGNVLLYLAFKINNIILYNKIAWSIYSHHSNVTFLS